jgi:Fur family transcriptional regulator, ferric uptake regulator
MPQPQGTRVRYTRQAAAVIAVMSGMPAFSDARGIREAVRRAGGRVGLMTVYRHLRVLAEQGRVDTIHGARGQALYRLRPDGFTHHLTCRVCGRTAEVDGREVWEWARQVAFLAGFTLTGHTVELTGVCPAHAIDARDPQAAGTRRLPDGEDGLNAWDGDGWHGIGRGNQRAYGRG